MNLLRIANRVAAPVSGSMNPDEIFMIRWTTRAEIARNFKDYSITTSHISPRDPALTFDFCRALANELSDLDDKDTAGRIKVFTKFAEQAGFELA
jgi:hypothetical protein